MAPKLVLPRVQYSRWLRVNIPGDLGGWVYLWGGGFICGGPTLVAATRNSLENAVEPKATFALPFHPKLFVNRHLCQYRRLLDRRNERKLS